MELKTESHCPVIKLTLGKITTLKDTENYLSELSKRIGEKQSFGIVMEFPNGQPDKERGCQKLENNWLVSYKSDLRKYCFGMAMVTDSWIMQTVWSPIIKQVSKRFFGVECSVFDCKSDAQIWLMDKYLTIK